MIAVAHWTSGGGGVEGGERPSRGQRSHTRRSIVADDGRITGRVAHRCVGQNAARPTASPASTTSAASPTIAATAGVVGPCTAGVRSDRCIAGCSAGVRSTTGAKNRASLAARSTLARYSELAPIDAGNELASSAGAAQQQHHPCRPGRARQAYGPTKLSFSQHHEVTQLWCTFPARRSNVGFDQVRRMALQRRVPRAAQDQAGERTPLRVGFRLRRPWEVPDGGLCGDPWKSPTGDDAAKSPTGVGGLRTPHGAQLFSWSERLAPHEPFLFMPYSCSRY